MASQRSLRGLDWFAFFVADVQTGWGPFVATYLTSVAWTQFDIGLILTIGTITGLALQIPAGALVDRVPATRLLAALAVASISASALLLALWPIFSVVVAAKVLHAIASSLLGPTLVAMSLGLVGHALFSIRLGRNVRFLSLGNAIAAGVAGGIAYYYSNQAIFFLTAALGIPTLIALAQISSSEIDPELARGGISKSGVDTWFDAISGLVHHRVLIGFAATIVLFQLANAAMLPILAGILAKRDPETAALVLSICILVPQFVVVAIAPWIGVTAQSWGRRPLLLLTFVALSARGAIFAVTSDPYLLVAAQLLDGISAASLGVLVPLIIADVTRGSGHFNFAQGLIGAAVGVGASFSTTLAGFIADTSGAAIAFLLLACVGVMGLVFVFAVVPETRGASS
ncbi:MAG TPA: MFS transporter [Bradyrhizobium sp.]|nr:MFS transporter [Bradyrhizobium sp.]